MLLSARILSFLILLAATASAQPYTLLIENGYVIDPATNRHDTLDIAIKDNKIAKIAQHIDPQKAKEEIDAKGMIVCPGLIDIHTHVFYGNGGDREYAGGPEGMHPAALPLKQALQP